MTLEGALAVDYEDIALGSGAAGDLLYVGDIGDNWLSRKDIVVYRLPEPKVPELAGSQIVTVTPFHLQYPDGAHDAESLFVDPKGVLHLVTKERFSSDTVIYRANLGTGIATTLERVASVRLGFFGLGSDGLATAADVSSDGKWLAIRTYSAAYLWRLTGAGLAVDLARRPCDAPLPPQQQGESFGFLPDGRGFVTASEGKRQTLWRVGFR